MASSKAVLSGEEELIQVEVEAYLLSYYFLERFGNRREIRWGITIFCEGYKKNLEKILSNIVNEDCISRTHVKGQINIVLGKIQKALLKSAREAEKSLGIAKNPPWAHRMYGVDGEFKN